MAIDYLYQKHRVVFVATAAAILAFGALTGLAWSAGFVTVFHRIIDIHWYWVPIALGCLGSTLTALLLLDLLRGR